MIILRQAESDSAAANNSESSGGQLQTAAGVFIVFNTLFVALRCYARSITKAGLGWDDFFLLIAYVFNIGLCITAILIVPLGGVGTHISEVMKTNPALAIGWAKGIFAVEVIYLTSVALPKLSVLFLYLRILTTRGSRLSAQATMLLISLNWAAFIAACFLQCRPLAFWWDKTIKGGVCFNIQAFFRIMCVPNLVTDLIVMSLPLKPILKLKLPIYKKIALVVIFLTASIGIVASIIRFTIFYKTEAFGDRTWSSVPLVGWSIVESSMYLIAACLPLLRPIFAKYRPAWSSYIASGIKSGSYPMEPLSQSGTRSGFAKLNTPNVPENSSTTKLKLGEVSTECMYEDIEQCETKILPSQDIEVTKEVNIQYSKTRK